MDQYLDFEVKVQELAEEDGVEHLFKIPGVAEILFEHYNNEAIEALEEDGEDVNDTEKFHSAVIDLAEEDGVAVIFTIPGIGNILFEHYNNEAIEALEKEAQQA